MVIKEEWFVMLTFPWLKFRICPLWNADGNQIVIYLVKIKLAI